MEPLSGNQTPTDGEQVAGQGAEKAGVPPGDGLRLASLLCLMPIAFLLFTWALVGPRSLAQTGLAFVVNAVILAVMIGLVRRC